MASDSSASDTRPSLLFRLRDAEDTVAWRLFLECYGPLIYGYCRRRGLQEADAADVSQDVMACVARSIRTFEYQPARGRFRGWLGAVVRSKFADFQERVRKSFPAEGGSAPVLALQEEAVAPVDDGWDEGFSRQVFLTALTRIRPSFDPKNWSAFEGVWLHDRPVLEVAKELGIPATSVYVAKSRVLKRLREEILELAEGIPSGCFP